MEILDEEERYEDTAEASKKREYIEKSPKAQSLIKKYDALVEKIEQEKNPIKLVMAKFKLNQLQAAIQKAIDLQQSKEEFMERKEYLSRVKEEDTRSTTVGMASLINKKQKLKLQSDPEYNPRSPYFMYDKTMIDLHGGLTNLVDYLKKDSSILAQHTADKIEKEMKRNKELDDIENSIKQTREEAHDIKSNYTKGMAKTNIQEMAMTVNNKVNIFSKIGNWFKSGKKVFSETMETRKEMRQLRKEKMERDQSARAARDARVEEAMKVYQEEMARAQQKLKEKLKEADQTHDYAKIFNKGYSESLREEYTDSTRKDTAKAYRDELHRMTGGITPTAGTQADDEGTNPPPPSREPDDLENF